MIALRDYQAAAITELRRSYASGHRAPCLVLPTGAGKTIVAAAIVRSAVERGRRVLFLAHREELLHQTIAKLVAVGLDNLRLIQAARDVGVFGAPVAVASVQTLATARWRDAMPDADLVVVDECHHGPARTWSSIASHYAHAHLLGLTATPQRGDGKALGGIFDDLVVGSTVRDLTALGHLVPCRTWAPPDVLESGELAMSPADAYAAHAHGERAVIFCSSVEHARDVAAEMTDRGWPTAVVHGSMSNRAEVLAQFRAGAHRAVASVHVLTEGWDDPGVSVCILARKPVHDGTFLQMVGRVLRPSPGKACARLVDLCGSVLSHGTPDAERAYALDGKAISVVDREAIRQCPTCGSVFLAADVGGTIGARTCPQCGAALPFAERKAPRSIGIGVAEVGTTQPTQRWTVALVAKFPGRCSVCRGHVSPGERIYWNKGEKPRHEACGRAAVIDEANRLMGVAS